MVYRTCVNKMLVLDAAHRFSVLKSENQLCALALHIIKHARVTAGRHTSILCIEAQIVARSSDRQTEADGWINLGSRNAPLLHHITFVEQLVQLRADFRKYGFFGILRMSNRQSDRS